LCSPASAHLQVLLGDGTWKGLSTWRRGTAARLAAETPKQGRKRLWQKRAQKPQMLESNLTLPKATGTFPASSSHCYPRSTVRGPSTSKPPVCLSPCRSAASVKITQAMLPSLSPSAWDPQAQSETCKEQEDWCGFFFKKEK